MIKTKDKIILISQLQKTHRYIPPKHYPNAQPMTTLQSEQQLILLRQKVFQLTHSLELTKIHNQNLLSQVAELKQKQQHQKQLNDMLVSNLRSSQQQVLIHNYQQISDQITLNINGQFLTQRILQLQQQLQKYRSGVSESVDRRVKKIVNEYTQEKQLQYQKKKSRLSMGPRPQNSSRRYFETHEHKYYNIEYKTTGDPGTRENSSRENTSRDNSSRENSTITIERRNNNGNVLDESEDNNCHHYQTATHKHNQNRLLCENCFSLEQVLNEKEEIIHKLNEQLRVLQDVMEEKRVRSNANTTTDEWKLKYLQTLKLYENLKHTHDQLLDEFNHLVESQSHQSPSQQPPYTITQSPITGFKKKQLYPSLPNANPCQSRFYNQPAKDRQQQMLQQITNLVNGLGRGKKPQKHQPQQLAKENYQPQYQKQHIYIQDKKSRLSYTNGQSRLSQTPKLDGSQFTIKQGVNRYGQGNGLLL